MNRIVCCTCDALRVVRDKVGTNSMCEPLPEVELNARILVTMNLIG